MHHLTLWLNMITLSVLVASGGLSFLRLLRIRARWQKYYLAYLGAYAAWLLFSTFSLFQRSYLLLSPTVADTTFAYARAGISFVIVIVGPLFYVTVGRQFAAVRRRPRSGGQAEWIVVWAVASCIVALTVAMFVIELAVFSVIATNLFNLYFALLAIRALVMVSGSPTGRHEPIRWFLWYSAIAHPLIVAVSLGLRLLLTPERFFYANVFAIGVFCLAWGILMIVADMRRIVSRTGDDQEVPGDLIQAMSLTARETEVVRALLDGMTSRDAAERLFISQRTVETHVSNVYRKCGVGNRVELVRLVGRYRAS